MAVHGRAAAMESWERWMRTMEAEERPPLERPGVWVRQVEGEGLEVHSVDPRLARRMVRCLEGEPGLLVWAAPPEAARQITGRRRKRQVRTGRERRVRPMGDREHGHMRERLQEKEEEDSELGHREEEGEWELREEDEELENEMLGGQGEGEGADNAMETRGREMRMEDAGRRRAMEGPEWGWPPFGDPG